MLRKAEVERSSTRFNEALRVYTQNAPLFDKVQDHYLAATFHIGFANVLNHLISAEGRKDYVDVALMEYTAASFHFERAGHERYQACVENNLGFLFGTIGKFEEAHEHLDRALMIATRLKDDVHVAQFDDARARVLLAEGRTLEAERTARAAVLRLEKGDALSLLAEALMTHGITLAKLDRPDEALASLERAAKIAEEAGDFERVGMASLTIIEQLSNNLSTKALCETIDRARPLLETTREISTLRRLAKAAYQSLFLTQAVPIPVDWTNFHFWDEIKGHEKRLIAQALKESGGAVTLAARLLGFKHHQSLIAIIDSRHKDLACYETASAKAQETPYRSLQDQKEKIHTESYKA